MSRSKKKPIIKDGWKNRTELSNRLVRHAQNHYIRAHIPNIEGDEDFILNIPESKKKMNDYVYMDWKINCDNCKLHKRCLDFIENGLKACKECKAKKSRK